MLTYIFLNRLEKLFQMLKCSNSVHKNMIMYDFSYNVFVCFTERIPMEYFTFFEPVVPDPDFTPAQLCTMASWAELVSGMARFGLLCVIISRCELMSLGHFVL